MVENLLVGLLSEDEEDDVAAGPSPALLLEYSGPCQIVTGALYTDESNLVTVEFVDNTIWCAPMLV